MALSCFGLVEAKLFETDRARFWTGQSSCALASLPVITEVRWSGNRLRASRHAASASVSRSAATEPEIQDAMIDAMDRLEKALRPTHSQPLDSKFALL